MTSLLLGGRLDRRVRPGRDRAGVGPRSGQDETARSRPCRPVISRRARRRSPEIPGRRRLATMTRACRLERSGDPAPRPSRPPWARPAAASPSRSRKRTPWSPPACTGSPIADHRDDRPVLGLPGPRRRPPWRHRPRRRPPTSPTRGTRSWARSPRWDRRTSGTVLTRLHAKGGIGQALAGARHHAGPPGRASEPRPDRQPHPGTWARFLKEARITGQLDTRIVPIYELTAAAGRGRRRSTPCGSSGAARSARRSATTTRSASGARPSARPCRAARRPSSASARRWPTPTRAA